MKSNGFGSYEQTIKIWVSGRDAELVSAQLASIPVEGPHPDGSIVLDWQRFDTKLGKDEDVVFDLFTALGELARMTEWEIDWPRSEIRFPTHRISQG
ncbi:Hypothetical protein NGAL_HAMBI2605_56370 [Neorhizobium galegae bv. orientalis]|nr:Hypothetical protein NGAL_HAMBI2605_56370 [Neorhizobium galegae bv. orientalis]